MVDFGQLSFAEQIRTVHDAAVLAGVSGSDLINAAFLPPRGVLVEMDPQNRGAQVSPCVLCHMETILLGRGNGKGGNEDGSRACCWARVEDPDLQLLPKQVERQRGSEHLSQLVQPPALRGSP